LSNWLIGQAQGSSFLKTCRAFSAVVTTEAILPDSYRSCADGKSNLPKTAGGNAESSPTHPDVSEWHGEYLTLNIPEFPNFKAFRRTATLIFGHLDNGFIPPKYYFDGEMRGGDTPPGRTKRQGLASGAESGIDSAKSIRMRCGKPGGGKGALIGDNLSHTLATGNDQTIICIPKEQECFDIRQVEVHEKEIAPTLIATDYKGGKAISFYPQRKAESMVPLEECSNTLVNGTCPGHQNAVCFENHGNDSRIKESPGVSPTITSRAGTGGGNLPLVMRDEERLASSRMTPEANSRDLDRRVPDIAVR
jgi:hypothetical protein